MLGQNRLVQLNQHWNQQNSQHWNWFGNCIMLSRLNPWRCKQHCSKADCLDKYPKALIHAYGTWISAWLSESSKQIWMYASWTGMDAKHTIADSSTKQEDNVIDAGFQQVSPHSHRRLEDVDLSAWSTFQTIDPKLARRLSNWSILHPAHWYDASDGTLA